MQKGSATDANKRQQRGGVWIIVGSIAHCFPTFLILLSLSLATSAVPSSFPAPAMMLVHKQPAIHLSQPSLTHRRHPSAPPTVIVQPTRTPGLLSLSKPLQKPSPQRQLQPNQRPNQHKQSPRPRPQQQQPRPALLNAAEIMDKKTAVRPSKNNQKQVKAQRSVFFCAEPESKH